MKDAIVQAAVRVLVTSGLNNWTVDEVSKQAGCAKGLVNYHHRSKENLLGLVAETLRRERWAERTAAISGAVSATGAIDRLWLALRKEVDSGRFAAWLSLLAVPALRLKAAVPPDQSREFVLQLSGTFDLGESIARAGAIETTLDGLQLRLLQGIPPEEVEEAYHRLWLTVLEM